MDLRHSAAIHQRGFAGAKLLTPEAVQPLERTFWDHAVDYATGLFSDDGRHLDSDANWDVYASENYACGPSRNTHRVNTGWLLVCGFRVFAMQGAFALLEAGIVRKSHVVTVMLKNMGDILFGTVAWWFLGYGIAFGDANADEAGDFWAKEQAFFPNIETTGGHAFWYFQFSFAATSTTIVSGMIAERAVIRTYLITAIIMTGFIYPVVVHWAWGGGWLSKRETAYVDFAGSSVVHVCGAFAGLAYITILGPRTGRFKQCDVFADGGNI